MIDVWDNLEFYPWNSGGHLIVMRCDTGPDTFILYGEDDDAFFAQTEDGEILDIITADHEDYKTLYDAMIKGEK